MEKLIVVGLGYVGIPIAAKFAQTGLRTIGIDIDKKKIETLNSGKSPLEGDEPGLNELISEVVSKNHFRATDDFIHVMQASAVIAAIDTPVDEETHLPGYKNLRRVFNSIGEHLSDGTLVVIESTIAPRTMEDIVKPALEESSGLKAGRDFMLACCPERVMPGRLLSNLVEYDRVVGGIDAKSQKAAIGLYKKIVKGEMYPVDMLTAEIVKTTENAYRDVQIAFANEVAMICDCLGADVFKVRELVNRSPQREMHLPGAGVGGHCIPKDGYLLISPLRGMFDARVINTAREVNDSMPIHMAKLIALSLPEQSKDETDEKKKVKIAVMGLGYLQNQGDTRNSPAVPLIEKLTKDGYDVIVHDPYVESFNGIKLTADVDEAVKGASGLVFVTAHDVYSKLDLAEIRKNMEYGLIVDGRNIFDGKLAKKAGFKYVGLGKGTTKVCQED